MLEHNQGEDDGEAELTEAAKELAEQTDLPPEEFQYDGPLPEFRLEDVEPVNNSS